MLKTYLDRYSRVVDDTSEKGMGNFKETMDLALAGRVTGQSYRVGRGLNYPKGGCSYRVLHQRGAVSQ
jgi:hypothetical protein